MRARVKKGCLRPDVVLLSGRSHIVRLIPAGLVQGGTTLQGSAHIESPATSPVKPKRRLAAVPVAQLSLADEVAVFEFNRLPDEVARYLAAVETFRLEGSPPSWRRETGEGV